jgi:hypothetical protein
VVKIGEARKLGRLMEIGFETLDEETKLLGDCQPAH